MVLDVVGRPGHQAEVGRVVVLAVAVHVMHELAGPERAAQELLHDEPVQRVAAVVDDHADVAFLGDAPSALTPTVRSDLWIARWRPHYLRS